MYEYLQYIGLGKIENLRYKKNTFREIQVNCVEFTDLFTSPDVINVILGE